MIVWLKLATLPFFMWGINLLSRMAITLIERRHLSLKVMIKQDIFLARKHAERMKQKAHKIMREAEVFELGSEVILRSTSGFSTGDISNPKVGSSNECRGTVYAMASPTLGVVWRNGMKNTYHPKDLMLYSSFVETDDFKQGEAKLIAARNIGDIVFIRPGTGVAAPDHPVIGSEFESDLKVMTVVASEFGNYIQYKCYNPVSHSFVTLTPNVVVNPAERLAYKGALFFTAKESLSGLYEKGDKFHKLGEYLYRFDEAVIIKVTPEVEVLFNKVKPNE